MNAGPDTYGTGNSDSDIGVSVGVSSLCMLHATLGTVLERVTDTFSHIEVICEGNHTDLEILESYNITVSFHAPFSDLNIASLNKAILKESLKQISENIELASIYNAEAVCIHPGHFSPLGLHFQEKVFSTRRESLKKLAKKAEECSVILGIENMPMFSILFARTPEEVKTILCEVDSDCVGFTFDLGHANITGNVQQFLLLKEHIITVHLHDNYGDEDTHLALGEGTVNLDIIKELAEKRLVIEVNTFPDAVKSLYCLKTLFSSSNLLLR
ncbi:MAG: sugar phosphate isomerase/epimerase [Theionarchaea archaeon]|nr:sugar phosphate isomerase/epimerase [Theionarchaea archaeon]